MPGMEVVPLAYEQQASPAHTSAVPGVRVVRDLRGQLVIQLTEEGRRTRAALCGEADLDCAPMLRDVLEDNLRLSVEGLDVDLYGLRFLDCSGLNVLLGLRQTAASLGRELRLLRPSAAVTRIVALTGTQAMLAADDEGA